MGEMKFYVTLSTSVGGVLGTEGFDTIEEAREHVRKDLLPILEAGDIITVQEND